VPVEPPFDEEENGEYDEHGGQGDEEGEPRLIAEIAREGRGNGLAGVAGLEPGHPRRVGRGLAVELGKVRPPMRPPV
jgi:hypothetical protein